MYIYGLYFEKIHHGPILKTETPPKTGRRPSKIK